MLEHVAVAGLSVAVLGLLLLVAALSAGGVFAWKYRKLAITQREAAGLCRKADLLTPGEASFFRALEDAVGDSYRIFPKVRLSAVAALKPGLRAWERWKAEGELAGRSVDFLLCDRKTMAVAFVVALEGPAGRDELLEACLRGAGLKLVRFRAQPRYDVREIRDKLGAGYASLP